MGGLFFNVGINSNEPTGDIIYVEFEKIESLSREYEKFYHSIQRPEFEKPAFACYETFKELNANLGYNLVLYTDLKRTGLQVYGSNNPIAVHSHYKLNDILTKGI